MCKFVGHRVSTCAAHSAAVSKNFPVEIASGSYVNGDKTAAVSTVILLVFILHPASFLLADAVLHLCETLINLHDWRDLIVQRTLQTHCR